MSKLPGVVAVLTGEDVLRWSFPAQSAPEGWGAHCMATDRVRFVGEPVAAVAATSRYVAEDAIELIMVDYDPLEAVADPFEAMKPESPLVMEQNGTNLMMDRVFNWGEVDRVFEEAEHVVLAEQDEEGRYENAGRRLAASPRGATCGTAQPRIR